MGGKSSKEGGEASAAPTTLQANSVLLNVYSPVQSSVLGGVYHTGIELYDTEYVYGHGASSLTGISSQRPRVAPEGGQWRFDRTVNLGQTARTREECRAIIAEMKNSGEWLGNAYSLTGKNCNHYTEAVAKALGLASAYPSWVNRGAKVMNAIGMGSGKQASGPVDLDGRPLREADRAALIMEHVQDVCVDSLLDLKRIGMLGGKATCSLSSIIPVDASGARTKLSAKSVISSDSDEQLLLFLPFTKPVKLLSFLLRLSVKEEGTVPRTVRLFNNRPSLDFSDAESTTATQVVEVPANPGRAFTKEEIKEGVWEHVVTLSAVKFVGCTFLSLFVESNHGGSTTKISGLTLVGRDK